MKEEGKIKEEGRTKEEEEGRMKKEERKKEEGKMKEEEEGSKGGWKRIIARVSLSGKEIKIRMQFVKSFNDQNNCLKQMN